MTTAFSDRLQEPFGDRPAARTLARVMSFPTGSTSAGYPYLQREAWELFRDRVPHVLGAGLETLHTAQQISARAKGLGGAEEIANVERAEQVIQQIVFTATITAPSDLWLMRHVLGAFAELGLLARLERGDAIYPASCCVDGTRLVERELHTDLLFLLSRGIVEQYDDSFRIAGHPRVRDIAREMTPIPGHVPAGLAQLWRRFFEGDALSDDVGASGPPAS